jgi:hypothetical protein
MADGAGQRFEPLPVVWQRLRQAQPGLGSAPAWLAALDACLREDPKTRPQSVAAMQELLGGPDGAAAKLPRAGPPPVVPVLEVERDAVNLPPLWAAALPPKPRIEVPVESVAAPDPEHAKVLAELDKTLAFIAAQATEEAQPKVGEVDSAPVAGPAAADSPEPGAAAAEAAEATAGPLPPKPLTQRQRLLAGVAVLVMLVATAATVFWLLKDSQPELFGGAPSATVPSAVAPAGDAAPVDDATTKALQAAEAALSKSPPRAGAPPPAAAAPAAPKTAPAPTAAKPKGPATPREACGDRTRFSLYQCLQTQCAKRTWTKHAQCVQFRKDQKL